MPTLAEVNKQVATIEQQAQQNLSQLRQAQLIAQRQKDLGITSIDTGALSSSQKELQSQLSDVHKQHYIILQTGQGEIKYPDLPAPVKTYKLPGGIREETAGLQLDNGQWLRPGVYKDFIVNIRGQVISKAEYDKICDEVTALYNELPEYRRPGYDDPDSQVKTFDIRTWLEEALVTKSVSEAQRYLKYHLSNLTTAIHTYLLQQTDEWKAYADALREQKRFEIMFHQLDTGEWVPNEVYGQMSDYEQKRLNRIGVEAFNSEIQAQNEYWSNRLQEDIKKNWEYLDGTGEWIPREIFDSLPPAEQSLLNTHGTKWFDKNITVNMQITMPDEATGGVQYLLDGTPIPMNGYTDEDGNQYLGWNDLSKEQQDILYRDGVESFNQVLAAELNKFLETHIMVGKDGEFISKDTFESLDPEIQEEIMHLGVKQFNKVHSNLAKMYPKLVEMETAQMPGYISPTYKTLGVYATYDNGAMKYDLAAYMRDHPNDGQKTLEGLGFEPEAINKAVEDAQRDWYARSPVESFITFMDKTGADINQLAPHEYDDFARYVATGKIGDITAPAPGIMFAPQQQQLTEQLKQDMEEHFKQVLGTLQRPTDKMKNMAAASLSTTKVKDADMPISEFVANYLLSRVPQGSEMYNLMGSEKQEDIQKLNQLLSEFKASNEGQRLSRFAELEYQRLYGEQQYVESRLLEYGSFIFPALYAAQPGKTGKDVSGIDWAVTGLQAGLLIIAPTLGTVAKAAGVGTKVGQTMITGSRLIQAGTALAYPTITTIQWHDMSPQERLINVAIDLTFFAAVFGKPIVSLVSKSYKGFASNVERIIKTTGLNQSFSKLNDAVKAGNPEKIKAAAVEIERIGNLYIMKGSAIGETIVQRAKAFSTYADDISDIKVNSTNLLKNAKTAFNSVAKSAPVDKIGKAADEFKSFADDIMPQATKQATALVVSEDLAKAYEPLLRGEKLAKLDQQITKIKSAYSDVKLPMSSSELTKLGVTTDEAWFIFANLGTSDAKVFATAVKDFSLLKAAGITRLNLATIGNIVKGSMATAGEAAITAKSIDQVKNVAWNLSRYLEQIQLRGINVTKILNTLDDILKVEKGSQAWFNTKLRSALAQFAKTTIPPAVVIAGLYALQETTGEKVNPANIAMAGLMMFSAGDAFKKKKPKVTYKEVDPKFLQQLSHMQYLLNANPAKAMQRIKSGLTRSRLRTPQIHKWQVKAPTIRKPELKLANQIKRAEQEAIQIKNWQNWKKSLPITKPVSSVSGKMTAIYQKGSAVQDFLAALHAAKAKVNKTAEEYRIDKSDKTKAELLAAQAALRAIESNFANNYGLDAQAVTGNALGIAEAIDQALVQMNEQATSNMTTQQINDLAKDALDEELKDKFKDDTKITTKVYPTPRMVNQLVYKFKYAPKLRVPTPIKPEAYSPTTSAVRTAGITWPKTKLIAERPINKSKIREEDKIRRIPPHVPIRFKDDTGATKELTRREKAGAVGWKQGIMYILIWPNYGDKNTHYSREPIPGVPYHTGLKSAARTLVQLGGKLPPRIQKDMGIMDVTITSSGGKPKISFKRDEKVIKKGLTILRRR